MIPGPPLRVLGPLRGGRNARVDLVEDGAGRRFVIKRYPPAQAGRDRFEVERTALAFLGAKDVAAVPRLEAADPATRTLTYHYIEGVPVVASEISESDFHALAAFVAHLRDLARTEGAAALPFASEAGISPAAVAGSIEGRLSRLRAAAGREPVLAAFLDEELSPVASRLLRGTRQRAHELGIPWDGELPLEHRTLSPSDLGFHNAVRKPDGSLVFLDFEHFGWDDPAKLIADLLLHPGMRLSPAQRALAARIMLPVFKSDPDLGSRLDLVHPLYGLKWCTILLNEFLPEELARRELSAGTRLALRRVQTEQLAKARTMLATALNHYERRSHLP